MRKKTTKKIQKKGKKSHGCDNFDDKKKFI